MDLNTDFSQRVLIHSAELPWVASPMIGVQRRMLDRIGEEKARATSVVKYEPGSHFSPHVHHGGEEFLVLEGIFQDEHGDYPLGSYIRNPPQSSHTPGSEPGCIILVKLWQFDPDDRIEVRLNTNSIEVNQDPSRPGVGVLPLFKDTQESVRIETWEKNTSHVLEASDGAEIFVLEGEFTDGDSHLKPGSWLRTPVDQNLNPRIANTNVKVWVKTGHLRNIKGVSL